MNLKKFINNKLVHSSLWLFVLQAFNTVIPLVTVPYITRLLTPEGYGLFSGALNWILYLQVLVEYGFPLFGARQAAVSRDRDELNRLYNTIQSARLFLLQVSVLLLVILMTVFGNRWENTQCMGILFLIVAGSSVQVTWLFQGRQDMKSITLINVFSRLISVALIFLLVKRKDQLYLYCFLYAITYVISGIAGSLIARYRYKLMFSPVTFSEIRKVLKEGFALFQSAAISSCFSGLSTTLLTVFSTASAVGAFSAIHKIPMVLNLLFTPISQSIYPYTSQLHTQNSRKADGFIRKMLLLSLLVFGTLCGVLISLHGFITTLLFGEEYVPYSSVIIPFALQTLFGIVNNFLGIQKLVAAGHQSVYSRAFTVAMALLVIADVLAVWFAEEAALVWCLAGAACLAEMFLTILLVAGNRRIKEIQ